MLSTLKPILKSLNKGQLGTKEYGHLLVGIATEYNEALLVIENASIGWATIQTVIERGYTNLFYSTKSDSAMSDSYFDKYMDTVKWFLVLL
jgi:hypothetical protein